MTTISLKGKTALVTGGSRGIGRAIAEKFLEAGADVAVNYNRTPVADFAAKAESLGCRGIAIQADVSVAAECDRLVQQTVEQLGRIDILVNNAGITRDGLLMRMKDEDWEDVMATNLRSVFACCRAASRPMMKQREGCILNVSSISGIMGNAGQSNYAASKAGVIGFSKSLARELASRNVRVNVIAPGFISSDMTDVLDEAIKEKVRAQVPLGRFGEPADIAAAALFLASPLAAYVTGATLVVDGGLAM